MKIAILIVVAVLTITATIQATEFTLIGNEYKNVTTSYEDGILWDFSTVDISQGGFIRNAYLHDTATLDVLENSGGTQGLSIGNAYAYNNSNLNISGGRIGELFASNNSKVKISGGTIDRGVARFNSIIEISGGQISEYSYFKAYENSIIDISGGIVDHIEAKDTSRVILHGYDFELFNGLFWDNNGKTILGTGILMGKWLDGTIFSTNIVEHDIASTIMAIPEPATLLLFGLGGVFLRRKRK